MPDADATAHVARARSLRSPAEAVDVYARWAEQYDHDIYDVLAFTGTDRIAELLAAHLPDRAAPIVDLGCGTGAAAAALHRHGFTTVDGLDISPEMLAVANSKALYRHTAVADLTAPLSIADATYGASFSAGTFTSGHVGPEAVAEAARILRPGAIVAWVIAQDRIGEFEPALADARLQMLHRSVEAVRRDGPAESVMLVAQLYSSAR